MLEKCKTFASTSYDTGLQDLMRVCRPLLELRCPPPPPAPSMSTSYSSKAPPHTPLRLMLPNLADSAARN